MSLATVLALVFALMFSLEWRYRLRSLRIAAIGLALAAWVLLQPLPHRATRRALELPVAERTTQIPRRDPLSEYAVGVLTMEKLVSDDERLDANGRIICVLALAWLALSPVFPSRRRSS